MLRCSITLTIGGQRVYLEDYDKELLVRELMVIIRDDTTYEEVRRQCDKNTLLCYRLAQIREIIVDSKKMHTKMMRYEQTVIWHIQRLYRIRNEMVHSGQALIPNLTPQTEHLHDFLAVSVLEVINVTIPPEGSRLIRIEDILAYLLDSFHCYKEKTSDMLTHVFDTGIIDIV